MKRLSLLLVLLFWSVVSAEQCLPPKPFKEMENRQDNYPKVADIMPEVTIDGNVPVLVNFWASWCQPCRTELPILDQLAAQGHRIYLINIEDEPAVAKDVLAQLGIVHLTTQIKTFSLLEQMKVLGLPASVVWSDNRVFRGVGRIHELDSLSNWLNCLQQSNVSQ